MIQLIGLLFTFVKWGLFIYIVLVGLNAACLYYTFYPTLIDFDMAVEDDDLEQYRKKLKFYEEVVDPDLLSVKFLTSKYRKHVFCDHTDPNYNTDDLY